MRISRCFLGLFLLTSTCGGNPDQPDDESVASVAQRVVTVAAPAQDPEIAAMVSAVDGARMSASLSRLVGFGTRNSCSSTTSATQGIGAARNWVRDQYAAAGLRVAFDTFSSTLCGGRARSHSSVYAWIPGTDPTRIVVVGGHMDSRSTNVTSGTQAAPGANDSGSQTSVVIEAARAMAGRSFVATVIFASFTGEEQGLFGSRSLVSRLGTLFPGATVEAALINDIVGGDVSANNATTLQQFRVFATGTPRERSSTTPDGTTDDTSPARGLMRAVALATGNYAPDMTVLPNLREDRPGRGSDHISFLDRSFPGVRFIEALENTAHQHSANDTIANMTPAYMPRVARVVIAAAATLARAPSAPRTITAVRNSSGSVTVSWTAPRSGAVDHYVVAARPISSNFYVNRIPVAATATSATVTAADLGITGGAAYFVSVAAVDAAGHESLFAYPEYRCSSTVCE